MAGASNAWAAFVQLLSRRRPWQEGTRGGKPQSFLYVQMASRWLPSPLDWVLRREQKVTLGCGHHHTL